MDRPWRNYKDRLWEGEENTDQIPTTLYLLFYQAQPPPPNQFQCFFFPRTHAAADLLYVNIYNVKNYDKIADCLCFEIWSIKCLES
jgi:hypothetical protein